MSDSNQLHNLLTEMVQAYSQKNQPPHIPTPAEIGVHLHPILDRMCADAEQRKASDIFISAGFPPAMKVNGVLTPMPHKALSGADTAAIVQSTMNESQLEAFNRDLELNYSVQSRSNTRYRVNAYHEQGRVGLVMRRINQNIPSIEELALPSKLKDLALTPRGLLILAGPTGSGKSTSMAAMVDYRNQKIPGHIVTIEDPIEYLYKPRRCIITQREVGIDTPDWKIAVQSAMRQAPDVVCIGEVRSEHSMEYALQLAQTGHLCVFTIHANNASQAIERIINFYPEERQHQVLMDLALNLIGIIGQRLIIKKGRSQRTAIIDLLLNTPAMQDTIFKGELMEIKDLMVRSTVEGMQTFDQNLFDLYLKGQVEYDEALRQADSPNDLRLRIQLHEEGDSPEKLYDRISDLNLM
ncbi:twitching motility - like protein [Neisseria animaloris]|uniref:Twitching motility - like protein n=1 Tax=Neisseria animaloris TaxID=326522 RepID=A0A1X3CJY9_9NEIS|nr:PilT/PilU family type 4a pilus ATPase [Neisseria animaloris]MDO5073989.1 PilT/PilU family type 4a pilus ATPase [Neisseria animaloris]OSI07858.1 type IV pili twitching motility protein PilT [Neisseria animaloris]VEH87720.1 twitching motility - like protein [Neisseria animaloris]VEJ22184.1 twitching motility - like protein [Neisseria animaloris]